MNKWIIAAASEAGTLHLSKKKPKQDCCLARSHVGLDGHDYLVVFTSDGAGSTLLGGEGASEACRFAHMLVKQWLYKEHKPALNESLIREWVELVKRNLVSRARNSSRNPDDYACTFLGAVIGPTVAAFMQIGDGGIVAGCNGNFELIYWPDNGEYENETYFLTDEDSRTHTRVFVMNETVDEAALFSDGLQWLVLNYISHQVHIPFFQSMFAVLRGIPNGTNNNWNEELANFLNSSDVNERTDDDKTLVLATRRSIRE